MTEQKKTIENEKGLDEQKSKSTTIVKEEEPTSKDQNKEVKEEESASKDQNEEVTEEESASEDQNEEVKEEGPDKFWYALQCYSLQEYKVRDRIFQLMEDEFSGKVFRVLLPEEETVEIRNNERQEKVTKIYPGYIFVESISDQTVWFNLRRIPGVSQLVGEREKPIPVTTQEIDKILRKIGEKTKRVEVDFEIDEVVKVISGPFRGYSGIISEINVDRGKIKALISIFGRETPVELDFDQVEKAVNQG